MRTIAYLLISPMAVWTVLLLLAAIFWISRRQRWAGYILLFSILWLLFWSCGWWVNPMVRTLENQYLPLVEAASAVQGHPANIHVLGGGHTLDERLPAVDQLSATSMVRLAEGVRLYRQLPGSCLVFSGWSAIGLSSQAEVTRRAAIELGVPATDIIVLSEPSNTQEEAKAYANTVSSGNTLIVVTDAVHMPRAMYHFEQQGLHPVPAPTNYLLKQNPKGDGLAWFPNVHTMAVMQRLLHEYAGMAREWFRD